MESSLKALFWNEGYLLGSLHLPRKVLRAAKEEATSLNFLPIFGEVYEEERDPFRLQASIPTLTPSIKKIYKRIKHIVQSSEKLWYTKRSLWTALKSLPGGSRQGIHKDFPSFETSKAILETNAVQASVVVALSKKTYFYAYPGTFGTTAENEKCIQVQLEPGDFILFRGDLVHAGAEYQAENIRLHCYVRVRGIKQKRDATEAVVFNFYMCKDCELKCTSKRHLSNHRRYCAKNPDKAKTKAKRRENDNRGRRCIPCNRTFKKRSTLYQHNHRRHPKRAKLCARSSRAAKGGAENLAGAVVEELGEASEASEEESEASEEESEASEEESEASEEESEASEEESEASEEESEEESDASDDSDEESDEE